MFDDISWVDLLPVDMLIIENYVVVHTDHTHSPMATYEADYDSRINKIWQLGSINDSLLSDSVRDEGGLLIMTEAC